MHLAFQEDKHVSAFAWVRNSRYSMPVFFLLNQDITSGYLTLHRFHHQQRKKAKFLYWESDLE
jgi:hypothetical protein